MAALIENLNLFGQRFVDFALPMLLQSSLLIVVIFTLDFVLRKRVRAVIRYALWTLVLIKLILPPTFASPTGVGYWLPAKQPDKPAVLPVSAQVTVRYTEAESVHIPIQSFTPLPLSTPSLAWPAILVLGWAGVALGLVTWLVLRGRFVGRMLARANDAPESLLELLQSCCRQLKIKRPIRLKFSAEATSPAACGLSRPTILIPAQLGDKLSVLPMRAVLLHELAHIKRGDLWVNYAQTLLQIFYWYNPLLWLANVVIRRVREQAVDEMVMVEMGEEADAYPTTLLEVAKLTFTRSVLSLGLVGIMESKTALWERIDRLMDFRPPRKAGLTFTSALCVLALGALAVPMGKAPPPVPVATNLVHREYRVDLVTFARNLLKRGGLPEIRISNGDIGRSRNRNAYDGPLVSGRPNSIEEQKSIQSALRRVLAEAGVETQPTEIDMWLFNCSEVWVKTAPEKLAAIERVLEELNGAPLQDVSRLLSPVPVSRYLPLYSRQIRLESQTASAENAKEVSQNNVDKTTRTETNAPAAGQTNRLPTLIPQKVEAATLVQDGRLLYELGKLDEAESKLKSALALDTDNKGAHYYLNLVEETRRNPSSRRLTNDLPHDGTATNLYTRMYKVDPTTFLDAARRILGKSTISPVRDTISNFFAAAGVDFQPPKNVFFNDSNGMLMVRATLSELDTVEQAVQVLNIAPPQIVIETKFIEVTEQVAKELWRKWPPTNNVGTNAWGCILTDLQVKTLLNQLDSKSDVDILKMPRVTTLSGRHTQIQVEDMRTVLKGINPQALTPPGIAPTDGATNSLYLTDTIPFGPALDMIPYVSADGYTISMTVIPTVTEFLGYDENRTSRVPVYIKGKKEWVTMPLPKFRNRQIVTSALVWDGQTLMVGNPIDANNQIVEKPGDGKKRLFVLVTPTIIDPGGNRVHKDDEIPPVKRK